MLATSLDWLCISLTSSQYLEKSFWSHKDFLKKDLMYILKSLFVQRIKAWWKNSWMKWSHLRITALRFFILGLPPKSARSSRLKINWHNTAIKGNAHARKHILMKLWEIPVSYRRSTNRTKVVPNPPNISRWILTIGSLGASTNARKRKILEAYYIKTQWSTLNDQLDIKSLTLFRFGIT